MYDPCESCKNNCKECKIYNDLIKYKKKNFNLNYKLRREEKKVSELSKKLGIANNQISNLREEKAKRW